MEAVAAVQEILDPRGRNSVVDRDAGPPAGTLRGKTVGLRRDEFWDSWDVVTDTWAKALEADGAEVVIWRAPVVKGGEASAEASESFEDFLGKIDVAISGLSNCGSCTLWAVHDGLAALDAGLPTAFVATEHFAGLTKVLTEEGGRSEIRLKTLPYPLEGKSEEEVREVAREAYDSMLEVIGATR